MSQIDTPGGPGTDTNTTNNKPKPKSKSKSKFATGSKFLSNNDDASSNTKTNTNTNDSPSSPNNKNTANTYYRGNEPIPKTDFNESDGRDTSILANHQLPLEYRWTLWHTAPKGSQGSSGWSENYKQIASFDTVGTFWQLFNNIAPPTMLRNGSSYHLFKGRVEPRWEDQFNKGGGSWTFRFGDFGGGGKGGGNKRNNNNNNNNNNEDGGNVMNYAWFYTVLNMIGNNFDYNENICGIVISIRKNRRGKIELWLKEARNHSSTDSIGKQFKTYSGAATKGTYLSFISHEDNKNGNRSRAYDV